MRSFIVCGPVSSGNRLMAAILTRSGLWGEGSTNQPKSPGEVPDQDHVIIVHYRIAEWIYALRARGFEITLIIMVRECHAAAKSAVERGHMSDFHLAREHIAATIWQNLTTGFMLGCAVELVPYSSLCEGMIREFLLRHRLPVVEGPLNLAGQDVPDQPANMNCKHYR